MRAIIFIVLIFAGCAADSDAEKVVFLPPSPPPVETKLVRIEKPVVKETTALTPRAILIAAAQAKTDATGYVAWKKSKPENIERLTTLTLNLDTALSKMRAGKIKGHYAPGDVIAAQSALTDLQRFLANKGD